MTNYLHRLDLLFKALRYTPTELFPLFRIFFRLPSHVLLFLTLELTPAPFFRKIGKFMKLKSEFFSIRNKKVLNF